MNNILWVYCLVDDNLKLIEILTTSSDKNLRSRFFSSCWTQTAIKRFRLFFDLIYNPNCAKWQNSLYVRSFLLFGNYQRVMNNKTKQNKTTNDAVSRKTRDEWDLNIWIGFVNLPLLFLPNCQSLNWQLQSAKLSNLKLNNNFSYKSFTERLTNLSKLIDLQMFSRTDC